MISNFQYFKYFVIGFSYKVKRSFFKLIKGVL